MSIRQGETLWGKENDPLVLLEDLYPTRTPGSTLPQERKCRLYLLACARRQWHRLPGVCRGLVELAEHIADRPREREALRAALEPIAEQLMHSDGAEDDLTTAGAAFGRIKRALLSHEHLIVSAAGHSEQRETAPVGAEWQGLAALVYLPFLLRTPPFGWVPRELHSVALLREVYYNPNLFVPFSPQWCDARVLAIARHVYDAREFSGMPVLGDALEEAGCDNPAVLAHCRNEPVESHARGCWVIDRVFDYQSQTGKPKPAAGAPKAHNNQGWETSHEEMLALFAGASGGSSNDTRHDRIEDTSTDSVLIKQSPPVVVGSAEWNALTERRAFLIFKKNREGLSEEEKVEFARLQQSSLEAISAAAPPVSALDEKLAKLEQIVKEKGSTPKQ